MEYSRIIDLQFEGYRFEVLSRGVNILARVTREFVPGVLMDKEAATKLPEPMPAEWSEHNTLDDLAVGTKFIFLPWPGDNDGHGGYKLPQNVWVKIRPGPQLPNYAEGYRIRASRLQDGEQQFFYGTEKVFALKL